MRSALGSVFKGLAIIALAACGQDDNPAGLGDTTAPAVVDDLHILLFDTTAVTIGWTAPGDDGPSGTATEYQIGYSSVPITPESWAGCAMLSSCPTPTLAGTQQSAQIDTPPVPDVYVALKAVDESGNWSELSNVAHGRTAATSDWTTYDTSDGLAYDVASGLAVAPDGALWCAHPVQGGGGVSRFDGATWKNYRTDDGLGSNDVLWLQAIAISSAGDVWVGTVDHGVSRFDGEVWTVYTAADGLLSDMVIAVAVAPNGDPWCAGPGLSRFDGEGWSIYECTEIGLEQYVFSVGVAPDGSVWAGGIGLFYFDGEEWTDYSAHHLYEKGPIGSIAFASSGAMWVGGDGVTSFDGVEWRHYSLQSMGLAELEEAGVTSIAVGMDGTVWAGTSNQGVVRFDGATWTRYTTGNGLADNSVFSVAVAPDGIVWFGTNKGISRYSGE
jgi:ligand-binding sensor domain-containing protein